MDAGQVPPIVPGSSFGSLQNHGDFPQGLLAEEVSEPEDPDLPLPDVLVPGPRWEPSGPWQSFKCKPSTRAKPTRSRSIYFPPGPDSAPQSGNRTPRKSMAGIESKIHAATPSRRFENLPHLFQAGSYGPAAPALFSRRRVTEERVGATFFRAFIDPACAPVRAFYPRDSQVGNHVTGPRSFRPRSSLPTTPRPTSVNASSFEARV